MTSAFFSVEDLDGGIRRLTLQRAPVNALNPAFLDALCEEYRKVAQNDSIRALIICSAQKVLSAGLDLKEAQGFDLQAQNEIVRGLNESFLQLYSLPKPTIVAVNGAAIAGGFFFVLSSDFRIAVPKASFGLAEVRVGATLPVGPFEIAQAELAPPVLRRLLFSGQPVMAREAQRLGIVDEICELDTLQQHALKVAQSFAALPPRTYAKSKMQLRAHAVNRIETQIEQGANTPKGGWFSDETKGAMQAMLAG